MINILIADDNIYYAKRLMDYINNKYNNIRVCNISINGLEALNILYSRNDIDIFLLDLKMPKLNGVQLLNKLNKEKYTKSCIVISGEITMINQIRNHPIVYSYILKSATNDKIEKEINLLIKDKQKFKRYKSINHQLDNILHYLSFNYSHVGTKYLKSVLLFMVDHSEYSIDNFKKQVYPNIAYKFNKSPHNIKCNINHSITSMYYNCDNLKLQKFFSLPSDVKPTTKLVINTIYNKLIS